MIRVDLHTHTSASHGMNSVREMFEAAQRQGLEVYGFSEHSPRPLVYSYPKEYREHLLACFESYANEVIALREATASLAPGDPKGPKVLFGMELDWFPGERAFMENAVRGWSFDYLIGGIHFLGPWGFDFTQDDWKVSPQQCAVRYENYFRTLKDMAESGIVNIAAHPDIIKLFTIDIFREWVTLPESQTLIASALTAIRDSGMAMEISSAGLRKPCHEIYPGPVIMGLAAQLGVPIAFGSDAHCTNTPAYAFDQLAEYARSYGYTHSLVFESGKCFTMDF